MSEINESFRFSGQRRLVEVNATAALGTRMRTAAAVGEWPVPPLAVGQRWIIHPRPGSCYCCRRVVGCHCYARIADAAGDAVALAICCLRPVDRCIHRPLPADGFLPRPSPWPVALRPFFVRQRHPLDDPIVSIIPGRPKRVGEHPLGRVRGPCPGGQSPDPRGDPARRQWCRRRLFILRYHVIRSPRD